MDIYSGNGSINPEPSTIRRTNIYDVRTSPTKEKEGEDNATLMPPPPPQIWETPDSPIISCDPINIENPERRNRSTREIREREIIAEQQNMLPLLQGEYRNIFGYGYGGIDGVNPGNNHLFQRRSFNRFEVNEDRKKRKSGDITRTPPLPSRSINVSARKSSGISLQVENYKNDEPGPFRAIVADKTLQRHRCQNCGCVYSKIFFNSTGGDNKFCG